MDKQSEFRIGLRVFKSKDDYERQMRRHNETQRIRRSKSTKKSCECCGWQAPWINDYDFHVMFQTSKNHSHSLISLHHIVPVSRGGTDEAGNLVWLCALCHGIADTVIKIKMRYRGIEGRTWHGVSAKADCISEILLVMHDYPAWRKAEIERRSNSQRRLSNLLAEDTCLSDKDDKVIKDVVLP